MAAVCRHTIRGLVVLGGSQRSGVGSEDRDESIGAVALWSPVGERRIRRPDVSHRARKQCAWLGRASTRPVQCQHFRLLSDRGSCRPARDGRDPAKRTGCRRRHARGAFVTRCELGIFGSLALPSAGVRPAVEPAAGRWTQYPCAYALRRGCLSRTAIRLSTASQSIPQEEGDCEMRFGGPRQGRQQASWLRRGTRVCLTTCR